MLNVTNIRNPILKPRNNELGVRDSCLYWHDGTLYLYFSTTWWDGETIRSRIDLTTTRDFATWTERRTLFASPPHFWSPGNVLRVGNEWVIVFQACPILPGQKYSSPDSRLCLARSRNLVDWSPPEPLNPQGAQVKWTKLQRQIDGYLIEHAGRYWCLYKGSSWEAGMGGLGLMVSDDLQQWAEASPDRPVIGARHMPDGAAVENPCVIRHEGEFRIFFAPCTDRRRIATARSADLLNWRDIRYLDVTEAPWMTEGFNAPMVLDLREQCGHWLMVFSSDRDGVIVHTGQTGLAWSKDLEHWTCP